MLSSEPAKPAGISPFPPGTVSSVPISYPSKATLSSRKLSEIPEDSEYLRTASSTFDPSKFAVPSKPRADITINAASTVPFAATSDQKFVDKRMISVNSIFTFPHSQEIQFNHSNHFYS